MMRDFCAILRIGQLLIGQGDNPKNEAAARRLVYGLADFVSPDQMEAVVRIAGHLDFATSAAALTTLGDEELAWAKELLYSVATVDGAMNADQTHLWDRLLEICERDMFDL